ncbi:MAG: substrate-binding domain-containing protein [Candidatus Margulisbacteria bacterium]|nr:substrate-binding domain-containing protein [Candidatus Margulisiibacteriota bacterium]MBU1022036.1 substrate-binding domain-containing protein [Candidatus Margulisiibacteriota bacterium]MBU1729631.1 substrate-binding domain-containing protein [Candidatus Margulisiibacteriota bacterium]MBU1954951.1 substrate-binding domain-containing protein [Candidatus Margulisiibacteriota bacterium]
MKKVFFLVLLCCLIVNPVFGTDVIKLATTTSTDNSGLLKALFPAFEKKYDVRVDVIAVGTGKAIKLGENGDVDVILVHARDAEDKFVADGFGVNRRDVMFNDFVILGPKNDPAKVKSAKNAADALKKIASSQFTFISRGDDSGTDKKEKALWKAAGIAPAGKWYNAVGQGMGATLQIANEKQGYTLADRGTYLAYLNKIDLAVVFEGDQAMFNPYGVIAVNPALYPDSNYLGAMQLIGWVTSVPGQKIIKDFQINGKPLFIPSAVK